MGFLDRLLGRDESLADARQQDARANPKRTDDEIAVERYRYLLRTAPPETLEQVHTEAFGRLTTEQRALVFSELTRNAPAGDAPVDESPAALARSATRSELRQPGSLEKSFAGGGGAAAGAGGTAGAAAAGAAGTAGGTAAGGVGGIGFGGMFASSLLGSVAGFAIGSVIAQAFIPDSIGYDQASDAGTDGSATEGSASDGAASDGADFAAVDDGTTLADGGRETGFDGQGDFGSDFGSDFGDFGV
ncbi:hypothetical protein B7R22_04965 [Subtercola boreus]|uniref:DUF2076 domain-containing protein n=1 Tax=Subtercola boreus TaxID=120213 RepID=A0A3E0W0Y4_9MICO|nr:hypothetical protein [Subtercola boreus]RFA15962.1 hypothetical protein B7R22_04965 [Subtercola boreus]